MQIESLHLKLFKKYKKNQNRKREDNSTLRIYFNEIGSLRNNRYVEDVL